LAVGRFLNDSSFSIYDAGISENESQESLALRQHIDRLRLLLIKYGGCAANINNSEDAVIDETESLLKNINIKGIKKNDISYLLGIVNYLKKDYKQALSEFEKSLIGNRTDVLKYDDILFINIFCSNNVKASKTIIYDLIKKYPDPKYYMILAYLDMEKNESLNAEMLCIQALRLKSNFAAAFLGLSVIHTMKGNFKSADEMIRKCTFHIHDEYPLNKVLYSQMRMNEVVIALLKDENERAKIILQLIISAENNDKALQLHKRCFDKNEKIQD